MERHSTSTNTQQRPKNADQLKRVGSSEKKLNLFFVEALVKSRPSKVDPARREYFTKWAGYKRQSWNQEKDFIGDDLIKMMVERDLLDLAPWFLNKN